MSAHSDSIELGREMLVFWFGQAHGLFIRFSLLKLLITIISHGILAFSEQGLNKRGQFPEYFDHI